MSLVRSLEASEVIPSLTNVDLAQAINASLSRVTRVSNGFRGAHARAAGHHVCVRYHRSQEPFYLSQEEAHRYLAWIRAGNAGPHWVGGTKTPV